MVQSLGISAFELLVVGKIQQFEQGNFERLGDFFQGRDRGILLRPLNTTDEGGMKAGSFRELFLG